MSCYVLGDEMRGEDRAEDRRRTSEKKENIQDGHTPISIHCQAATKVLAVRKVKISIFGGYKSQQWIKG